jgi:predicted alpha/beta-hydrolase family hydrolase
MIRLAELAASASLGTVRFDFPYRANGKSWPPDRNSVLLDSMHDALDGVRKEYSHLPLLLGGHSMGGRIAAELLQKEGRELSVSGYIASSFPLGTDGLKRDERVAMLRSLPCSTLLFQGARDAKGRAEELVARLASGGDSSPVVCLPEADHGWALRKSSGLDAAKIDALARDALQKWILGVLPSRDTSL